MSLEKPNVGKPMQQMRVLLLSSNERFWAQLDAKIWQYYREKCWKKYSEEFSSPHRQTLGTNCFQKLDPLILYVYYVDCWISSLQPVFDEVIFPSAAEEIVSPAFRNLYLTFGTENNFYHQQIDLLLEAIVQSLCAASLG